VASRTEPVDDAGDFDWATADFVKQLGRAIPDQTGEWSIDQLCEVRHAIVQMNGIGPSMYSVEALEIDTETGSLPVRVLIPIAHPRAIVLYLHSGGWISGSIDDVETIARKLAERTGSIFVVAGYRYAPEDSHDIAEQDASDVLKWSQDHAVQLAGRPVPVMVMGEGYGAYLAATAANQAQRESRPVSMQILVTPLLSPADACLLQPGEGLEGLLRTTAYSAFWRVHAAPADSDAGGRSLLSATVDQAPPTVLAIAERSPFRDDAESFAERLGAAGVNLSVRTFADQIHGFFGILMLPASEKGFQQIVKAIRANIARPDFPLSVATR
jgi:acetyl esterase